jgi:hypothetical protein
MRLHRFVFQAALVKLALFKPALVKPALGTEGDAR